jgi:hypothetical protein
MKSRRKNQRRDEQPVQQHRKQHRGGIFTHKRRHHCVPETAPPASRGTGVLDLLRIRQEAELRRAGPLQQHHRMYDRSVRHRGIGLHEDRRLRIAMEHSRRAAAHGRLRNRLVRIAADIDVEPSARVDRQHQRLVLVEKAWIERLCGRGRQIDLDPSLSNGAVIMKMISSTNITSI